MAKDESVNVRPVTPNNWLELIAVTLCTPIVSPGHHPEEEGTIWGPPINTIGLSGVSKSQRIRQIAESLGMGVHIVYTATKQPASFEGAMVPTKGGIVLECALPAARECIKNNGGVIFLDEVNGASPRTQASMMSTLNDRQVGDHILPPKTRMLLAMNPDEYSAGGFAMSAPMANRMGHVWYQTPTKQEWGQWLNGLADTIPNMKQWEKQVLTGWQDNWRVVNALMQGFLERSGSDVLLNQPEPDSPLAGQAWPSYRTWHWALCALTAARCVGVKEATQFDLVAAYCGHAASTAWTTWIVEADLPTPEEMLTKGYKPDNRRLDRTYAALTNMTDYLCDLSRSDKTRPDAAKQAEKGWNILMDVTKASLGDLAVSCASKLCKADLGRRNVPKGTETAATAVIKKLGNDNLTRLAP